MTTPTPRDSNDNFVEEHVSMDDRLEEAFRRYDAAFQGRRAQQLAGARIDLSLILWADEDPPQEVTQQMALDGEALLRDTPPLEES
jgi:hypothetical protein